jgi:hypothetical protein
MMLSVLERRHLTRRSATFVHLFPPHAGADTSSEAQYLAFGSRGQGGRRTRPSGSLRTAPERSSHNATRAPWGERATRVAARAARDAELGDEL